jgi:transcriptional regulator with XRE-family HTH domain
MTIREQVRAAYLASGLTQEEIAFRAGVSSKTLWNILSGRNADSENLFAVCVVLGLTSIHVSDESRRLSS